MPHLYPSLKNSFLDGDYYLLNNSDGNGTQVVWLTSEVTKPTDTELANAKEAAVLGSVKNIGSLMSVTK